MSLDQSLEELKRRLALEPSNRALRIHYEQSHSRVHGHGPYPTFDLASPMLPVQYGDYYIYEVRQDGIDSIGSYPVHSYHGRNRITHESVQLRVFPIEQNEGHYSLYTELSSQFQMIPEFKNPTILPILDFDHRNNQTFYIARACPEGEGLLSVLKRSPSLKWRLDSFLMIAKACRDIHEELIIHGSLRSENVFVSKSGNAHLWFWDEEWTLLLNSHLSRILTIPTASPSIAKRHMACQSPEYANLGEIGMASDVYQLGIILFEMLTERISGTQRSESLRSIFQFEPTQRILRDTDLGAQIPSELSKKIQIVCNKALSIKPEHRYQSVAELIEDYQQILQDHHEPRYLPPRS